MQMVSPIRSSQRAPHLPKRVGGWVGTNERPYLELSSFANTMLANIPVAKLDSSPAATRAECVIQPPVQCHPFPLPSRCSQYLWRCVPLSLSLSRTSPPSTCMQATVVWAGIVPTPFPVSEPCSACSAACLPARSLVWSLSAA